MKKLITTTTAAILALSAPAFAGGLSAGGSGTISGSSKSLSATAGVSTGNGSTLQRAGNFSASQGTLSGGISGINNQGGNNLGTLTITTTSETFSEGSNLSKTKGSALGGSLQAGYGLAEGDYEGWGAGSW